jgi:hypothetical protein
MEAVKQQAQQQGLQVDQLPQGSYGNLPLRRRMSLPFGSIVTVLSRQ